MVRAQYFMLSFSASFFLLALLFLFLVTTVHPSAPATLAEAAARPPEAAYLPDAADALTVLFFGVEEGGAAADSYLLARFDPVRGQVSVAVLPPAALVGGETLEEAYRYGGARYTRDALREALGVPIDRTVRLTAGGFVAAAAAIGTVEVDLAREYTIADGPVEVILSPGRQLLDGKKLAALLRAPLPGGDEERCRLTAELACAVIDQRIDVANSVLVEEVFQTVVNLVDTDISYADFERRLEAARHMAGAEGPVAVRVSLDGDTDSLGRLTLSDTSLAALARQFI